MAATTTTATLTGFEDLPLELIAAIADDVRDFVRLGAMMLVSRRLRDGVSLSWQWRIANEVIADVQDVKERRKILLSRHRTLVYGSRHCEHARLLRYLQPTLEEARVCLPVACLYGRLECVRYLTTAFDLSVGRSILNNSCIWNPIVNEHMVAYPQSRLKCTGRKFEEPNSPIFDAYLLACSCPSGLPVIKYLHEEVGVVVPPEDSGWVVIVEGLLDIFQYLHANCGVIVKDNLFLRLACTEGHLHVVKYLHATFNLTPDDVREQLCISLVFACEYGHLPVVQYLHTTFGLTNDDANASDGEALRFACANRHLPVVQYLHTAFGITADDA